MLKVHSGIVPENILYQFCTTILCLFCTEICISLDQSGFDSDDSAHGGLAGLAIHTTSTS